MAITSIFVEPANLGRAVDMVRTAGGLAPVPSAAFVVGDQITPPPTNGNGKKVGDQIIPPGDSGGNSGNPPGTLDPAAPSKRAQKELDIAEEEVARQTGQLSAASAMPSVATVAVVVVVAFFLLHTLAD